MILLYFDEAFMSGGLDDSLSNGSQLEGLTFGKPY